MEPGRYPFWCPLSCFQFWQLPKSESEAPPTCSHSPLFFHRHFPLSAWFTIRWRALLRRELVGCVRAWRVAVTDVRFWHHSVVTDRWEKHRDQQVSKPASSQHTLASLHKSLCCVGAAPVQCTLRPLYLTKAKVTEGPVLGLYRNNWFLLYETNHGKI